MKKHLPIMALLASIFFLPACANFFTELGGDAKPKVEGADQVPNMKTYKATLDKVWLAVTNLIVERDISYDADTTSGRIETEWFEIQKITGWEAIFAGSNYSAKEFIAVGVVGEGTSVRFQARFKKEVMSAWVTEDKQFPEAEYFLRKRFFEDLDAALAASSLPAAPETETPPPPSPVDARSMQKTVKVKRGNIRLEPSTRSRIIEKAYYGQDIDILGKNGQWYEIITPSGQKGWAHEVLFRPKPRKKESTAATEMSMPPLEPPEVTPETALTPVSTPVEETSRVEMTDGGQPVSSVAPGTDGPSETDTDGSADVAKTDRPTHILITDVQPEEAAAGHPDAEPLKVATDIGSPIRPQENPSEGQGSSYVRIADGGPAALLESASALAPIITTLPAGTKLALLGKRADYYMVEYQSKKGYVYKASCSEAAAGKAAGGQVQTSGASGSAAGVHLRVLDKGPARLLEEPNAFSQVIGSVPSGTRLECIKKVASFYQVQYQGKTGYLYKDSCEEAD
jgi:uncharacterized protein YgiM (DUF1202 family)